MNLKNEEKTELRKNLRVIDKAMKDIAAAIATCNDIYDRIFPNKKLETVADLAVLKGELDKTLASQLLRDYMEN